MSKKLQNIIDTDKQYLFQNYGDKLPVCFVSGEGPCLFDQDGKKYVDLFSGVAVANFGYSSKNLKKALQKQIDNIMHSSNHFYNKEQAEAGKWIAKLAFGGKTLFQNSGTEANEAAIKLARKYGQSISPEKYWIITFNGSFHGRTFGSMTATAQEKTHSGFGPIVPGFIYCPFNDINAFKAELEKNGNVCAILIEMIQGEGGINIADKAYVKELFDICAKNKILTIIDEVQTGFGRTGKMFAYEHYGIKPDVITLAKGLGCGMPVGAIHAKEDIAKFFTKGVHGTTFGGNHLACSAITAISKELSNGKILKNVNTVGKYIFRELQKIQKKTDIIKEIRGMGLHIGIELNRGGMDIVKSALKNGLVINCTVDKVLRIMPPLNITLKAAGEGMALLEKTIIEAG
ncbi:MAG: aspartate aminotransferase family protein [Spirochaetes bacterium]|nr:aspartate aminotransferase family protein [Spirochaetota bacterium]